MKRIYAAILLSAVLLGGGVPAAHAQEQPQPRRFSFGFGARMPADKQPAAPATPVAPVELASMESRTITVPAQLGTPSSTPPVQSVSCRSLVIDFELKGVGPSGVGSVELWYTRNGQLWRKYPGAPQTQSPFVVDVTQDGLYGFTVVATNGMGIGKGPPQPGDPPHVWVDVDTTKPEVHLLNTQSGADAGGRTLTLRWTASDRNLVARPITLSYAEQSQGPWIPFATNLENCGYYTWRMSPGLPAHVLVRVEATDRVGNISGDQSTLPAPVDMLEPTATIKNISHNGTIVPVSGTSH
jgi:hypothetical protein